jgi:hypothetical protein
MVWVHFTPSKILINVCSIMWFGLLVTCDNGRCVTTYSCRFLCLLPTSFHWSAIKIEYYAYSAFVATQEYVVSLMDNRDLNFGTLLLWAVLMIAHWFAFLCAFGTSLHLGSDCFSLGKPSRKIILLLIAHFLDVCEEFLVLSPSNLFSSFL